MKKIFTLIACAVAALSAQAKDYTGKLSVSVNGSEATPTETTISVEQATDGTYSLSLKNFALITEGEAPMYVGTINIQGVKAFQQSASTLLLTSQNITIEAGDTEGVGFWYGPMLGPVPVEMVGEVKDDAFRTAINIEFGDMAIVVEFANSGFQLPNSGFENYHTASHGSSSGQEANGWHMFYSGQGSYVSVSAPMIAGQTNQSDDVRPGSTGQKSLLLSSKKIVWVVANGTATTGRLNVGSMTAADASNYSFNNMAMTDVDDNGDPFYAPICGQPDSLTVWVKFKQGSSNKNYPYASLSAVLNNGDEYRDPEVEGYTSGVVAKAVNKEIAETGSEWKRLTVPFDYDSYKANGAEGKCMLVTFSTNATPGQGSGGDNLYIDDIALVYNAQLSSLKYNGQSVTGFSADEDEYTVSGVKTVDPTKIEATANGRGAYIVSNVEEEGQGGVEVSVSVISEDLKTINTYYISFPDATGSTTGISAAEAATTTGSKAIYNAAGQRTSTLGHGLNILRQQGGKTVKVVKK